MHERSPVHHEGALGGKDTSFENVSDRLHVLLDSLDEALERSPLLTTPDDRAVPPVNEIEYVLARAQTFRDAVRGLVEKMRAQNEYHGEEAAALSEAAFEHLVGYLSVITDLNNLAEQQVPHAAVLAETIGEIALQLLPTRREHSH